MSLQGSYQHFCLWMFLGTTLALGQGQGKEAMPPLPARGTLLQASDLPSQAFSCSKCQPESCSSNRQAGRAEKRTLPLALTLWYFSLA